MTVIEPIEWHGDRVRLLDQRRLPSEEVYVDAADYRDVADAIRTLCVRGAPAIGVAGAYGAALAAQRIETTDTERFRAELRHAIADLRATRPTAVNLSWALNRVEQAALAQPDINSIKAKVIAEACLIHEQEQQATERLSKYGADLIEDGWTVMTHCNAGGLATCGCGTALGVLKQAKKQGKTVSVIAGETRPLLQGARLTAWELVKEGIPVTLIVDSAAGHFISRGAVQCIIVGADRVAANGDFANKIGTYALAVLAAENDIPFLVAAPVSTVDISLGSGDDIPIEERCAEEVTHIMGKRIAAEGVAVANPAFDVTPSRYVTAMITDMGIVRQPYVLGLDRAVSMAQRRSEE